MIYWKNTFDNKINICEISFILDNHIQQLQWTRFTFPESNHTNIITNDVLKRYPHYVINYEKIRCVVTDNSIRLSLCQDCLVYHTVDGNLK